MAQKWREGRRAPPPLDPARLERLALRYVERYATTRAKLGRYLERKVKERGWAAEQAADIAGLVQQMADLRYVDDGEFAAARTSSLMRRGYGPRRVDASLRAAGILANPVETNATERWEAALAFARRKRIGPFAVQAADRAVREKAFAAMMRAGHESRMARALVQAIPGEIPTWDEG